MLANLDRARKEKNVSIVDMADLLQIRSATVSEKISGKYDFKFGEALKIKRVFFPEYELEYLFDEDE
ncbi:helix-turn-helix transcriptional regulator [Facklamia languida]